VTFALTLLLVVCFLLAPAGWGLAPASPVGPELLTYQLVHQDWIHLGSNVTVLVAFGTWFERRRGPFELLGLLVVAGVLSGWVEAAMAPTFSGTIIGASGAVSALLGAFGRFERWSYLVVVPVLGYYTYAVLGASDGVANWAHLTGFAVGLFWAMTAPGPQTATVEG